MKAHRKRSAAPDAFRCQRHGLCGFAEILECFGLLIENLVVGAAQGSDVGDRFDDEWNRLDAAHVSFKFFNEMIAQYHPASGAEINAVSGCQNHSPWHQHTVPPKFG